MHPRLLKGSNRLISMLANLSARPARPPNVFVNVLLKVSRRLHLLMRRICRREFVVLAHFLMRKLLLRYSLPLNLMVRNCLTTRRRPVYLTVRIRLTLLRRVWVAPMRRPAQIGSLVRLLFLLRATIRSMIRCRNRARTLTCLFVHPRETLTYALSVGTLLMRAMSVVCGTCRLRLMRPLV